MPHQFYLNIIDFLASLLDSRAGNFRAHAHTVSLYSQVICQQLGLDSEESEAISTAAYLHDIHKLIQRGEDEDVALIERLLESIDAPIQVGEMLRSVNLRFDGKGVKDGQFRGEEIPLGARIIAVANAFDEISRGRVDTQVIRKDHTFEALQKRSGSYLDPKIVRCLVEGLKTKFTNFFRPSDSRVMVISNHDDFCYGLANSLMNNGYEAAVVKEIADVLETVDEFSPQAVIIDRDILSEVVNVYRDNDRFLHRPVIVVGESSSDSSLRSTEYVAIDTFITRSSDYKPLLKLIENTVERVMRQDAKARDNAEYYASAGNNQKAGEIFREIGDYRLAAKNFEIAQSYGLAAEMYELLKSYAKAARSFEMAGDYLNAAKYYDKVGMYEERGRVFEKTGDYYYSAKNKLFRGEKKNALALFKQITPSHQRYRKACYYLAKIYMEEKEWQNALKCYEKVIAGETADLKNIRHYYNVAVAYEHLGKYSEAGNIYEKIMGIDYNFRDVYKRNEKLRSKVLEEEKRTKMEQKVADFVPRAGIQNTEAVRYERHQVLGRGGMGIVYEATDLVLGRKIALKVLSAALKDDPLVVETFTREAKAAAMLNHVNIVTIYDAGIENSNYFIAMEVIQGNTLKEIIQEKRFSIASVLRLMRQICNGLKYAHSKKIIHRDLTNSNIMLTKDNVVKIMDFGLARIVEHLLSEQSIIGGTPSYMAPEQVKGAPIDHRADIYALGVNMFELTTGRLPFLKGDLGYHHLHTPPPSPQDINPKIPSELDAVILKCLQKEPSKRFQSVEDLIKALKL